jgi:hypothetical protein
VEIDLRALLALPADERRTLAEILNNSVGYPADIDSVSVPAWRQAEISRQLERFTGVEPGLKPEAEPRGVNPQA